MLCHAAHQMLPWGRLGHLQHLAQQQHTAPRRLTAASPSPRPAARSAKLDDPSSSGAVFFAVCRGKVSEGLDFADRAGRAVVITGIPYAMKTDPKVGPGPDLGCMLGSVPAVVYGPALVVSWQGEALWC